METFAIMNSRRKAAKQSAEILQEENVSTRISNASHSTELRTSLTQSDKEHSQNSAVFQKLRDAGMRVTKGLRSFPVQYDDEDDVDLELDTLPSIQFKNVVQSVVLLIIIILNSLPV